jgi:riboflavin kinase/FMN adenylyltransferase
VKVYHKPEDFIKVKKPVVTVGTFDGVHVGHQKIFEKMRQVAGETGGETVVITFFPHPRLVIHPNSRNLKFINTRKKKYSLIEKAGIDHLVIIPFTKEFSRLSSEVFIKDILIDRINVHNLIIGYDHHFGRNRNGSYRNLLKLGKLYGFNIEEVPARNVHNMSVSSTKIRNALRLGMVSLANDLLGYEYSITGKVIPGRKIGKTMGFPTANIELEDKYKLITAVGVYACRVEWKGKLFKGMGNIGYRPTVDHGGLTIEVHIFDFSEHIYGETITIYFVDRIRDEIKFKDIQALRDQLVQDEKRVLKMLS